MGCYMRKQKGLFFKFKCFEGINKNVRACSTHPLFVRDLAVCKRHSLFKTRVISGLDLKRIKSSERLSIRLCRVEKCDSAQINFTEPTTAQVLPMPTFNPTVLISVRRTCAFTLYLSNVFSEIKYV